MPDANAEHPELVRLYRSGEVDTIVLLTVQHLRSTLTTIDESHVSQAL